MYTVHARNQLFETLLAMVRILYDTVSKVRTVGLDYRLVVEMVQTGLRCPGFNPRMKYALVECAGHPELLDNMSRDALTLFPFDTLTWLSPFDVASLTVRALRCSRLFSFPSSLLTMILVLWHAYEPRSCFSNRETRPEQYPQPQVDSPIRSEPF